MATTANSPGGPTRCARFGPAPTGSPSPRFWRRFEADGPRAIAVDVPLTYAPEPFDGVELCGWASHDRMTGPCSFPGEVLEWVDREFGSSPRTEEEYGLLPLRGLLRERDAQCRLTDLLSQVAERLLRRETWDLFVVACGATHRGDTSCGMRRGSSAGSTRGAAMSWALPCARYITCDRAVGRLHEGGGQRSQPSAGSDARPDSRGWRPPRVQPAVPGGSPPGSATRGSVRVTNRSQATTALPIQDCLSVHRLVSEVARAATPAFCLPGDIQGYIRLNQAGRETRGILTAEAASLVSAPRRVAGAATTARRDS